MFSLPNQIHNGCHISSTATQFAVRAYCSQIWLLGEQERERERERNKEERERERERERKRESELREKERQ
jgi:hypothetical protein